MEEQTQLRLEAERIRTESRAASVNAEFPRVERFTGEHVAQAKEQLADALEHVTEKPTTTRETRAERIARREASLEARKASLEMKSAEAARAAHSHTGHIPLGQPILIGHHSERRHRNALAKADRAMRKSVELHQAANRVPQHATRAILSDDADCLEQLQRKLADLEATRDQWKAQNAAWRKYAKNGNKAPLHALGLDDAGIDRLAQEIENAYSWEKQPVPAYRISNLGATIRTTKQRIAQAEAAAQVEEAEEEIHGARCVTNPDANRFQIFFDSIPAEALRTDLKRNAFKWSRRNGCWQRHLSADAERIGKYLVSKHLGPNEQATQ